MNTLKNIIKDKVADNIIELMKYSKIDKSKLLNNTIVSTDFIISTINITANIKLIFQVNTNTLEVYNCVLEYGIEDIIVNIPINKLKNVKSFIKIFKQTTKLIKLLIK